MLKQIDIKAVIAIAQKAGDAIMEIYGQDFDVEYKDDKSPLTQADQKAHDIIVEALNALHITHHTSSIPILSEEGKEIPYDVRKEWDYFWMVDPLDGTKEFIKKNDEFTVNIALINGNEPVLGVVFAPAIGEIYYAKRGEGAYKMLLEGSKWGAAKKLPIPRSDDKLVVVASKSHLSKETQLFIDDLQNSSLMTHRSSLECISKGSSLKLCMVAEGSADIYPRLAPTMEWDTAAASAIVLEAGKMTYQTDEKTPLLYNKEDLLNPWFIVK